QRDRGRELELRTPVECDEPLTIELEGDGHDRTLVAGPTFAPPRDLRRARPREDRGVVLHRLRGVAIKPEIRRDRLLGHRWLLSATSGTRAALIYISPKNLGRMVWPDYASFRRS